MDQPTEIRKSEQIGAILLLAILIIVGLIYLIIKPQLANLKENNLELAVNKNNLKNKEQQINNLNQLASQIQSNQTTVQKLTVALPDKEKIAELLVQIDALSSGTGTKIAAFSPVGAESQTSSQDNNQTSVSAEKGVGMYSFDLTLAGPYSGIANYLKELQKNLRPIKIMALSITGGSSESPILSATFNMQTYYQK